MSKPRFLTAEWRWLVMLNYETDASLLRRWTPAGVEIDDFDGRTFLSVVGFRFLKTKVLGVPIPFHRDFDEVNLRFYVRRKSADGWRRGVVFIKEIVPRAAIAWTARAIYNENYVCLPMRSQTPNVGDAENSPCRAAYEWNYHDRWHRLAATFTGKPTLHDESSEESFITEHYWGYARQRDGSTVEYQVEHPRWNVWQAVASEFDCDVANFYGPEFRDPLSSKPSTAFVADGSSVVVRAGARLP